MAKAIAPKGMHPPIGMYTHGMSAVGEIVVVAGQVGIDPAGNLAGPDVESQTRQALANIGHVLKAAGCRWSDVVRMQTFLTGPGQIPGYRTARTAVLKEAYGDGPYPPNTLLIISQLAEPRYLIEIEAMAVRPLRAAAAAKPARKAAAKVARPKAKPKAKAKSPKRKAVRRR